MSADPIVANILTQKRLVPGAFKADLPEAFDMQDQVTAGLAAARGGFAGYKIAWNTPALIEKFGMPHPGMGRVFVDQLYDNDAQISLAAHANLMMEPEIIARLGADISPGDDLTPEALAAKVEGFTVGFEILDRLGSQPSEKAPAIIAHNVFNAGAVMGRNWVAPSALETTLMHTKVMHDGEVILEGQGLAPQPPLEALAFLAGHFCGRGQVMRAGQMVLCGSHMPLYPIEAPGRLSVSMSDIGETGFTVV